MSQPTTCHKTVKISYIAMGSNVTSSSGSPQLTINETLRRIPNDSISIEKVSRFYATPAFPPGSGPDFVNAAIAVETSLAPHALLSRLHKIERELGRERKSRWAARTIDLDLIAFDDCVLPDLETFEEWSALPLEQQMNLAPDHLILPHPRLQDRSFVLGPLCDIASDWRHPVLGQTAAEMFAARPDAERASLKPLPAPA
ncbi:MAG: 2-amino-4-hydroxy-6-hydroxymethyldihydropteridine diphosphokinase [Pseudomonadota bacterium]